MHLGTCLWPWKCVPHSAGYDTHWHIGNGSILIKDYYFVHNCNEIMSWWRHTKVSKAAVVVWGIGFFVLMLFSASWYPSFWPLFSHLPRDVSNSHLLPPRNVVRDLIFCLVIPWDLWMKRTIKIQNVFLGGGFQNWSLWGSHPLGYWISSLCNVEKAVWWKLAPLASPKKQTSSLFKVKHTHWGSLHHFFKWMKTSQAELMKCRISANRLHPSSFGHKERWSANSPQRTLPV